MVAAENDFLPGAKVGGVGDVLRDLPPALVAQGQQVDVVLPSYGFLVRLPGLELVGTTSVYFSRQIQQVELYRVPDSNGGAVHYILHHPGFAPHGEKVYCDDPGDRPFSTDATKFAFFCAAVASALTDQLLPIPNVLHCHDWHTAFLLMLLKYGPRYSVLSALKTVFTIHNLAMQGVRPFRGDESSLDSWFADLHYSAMDICDRHYPQCVNPMRAAIRLADIVHTVSPTYAEEILRPSHHDRGIYGGEGLQDDLLERYHQGDVIGIINGCEYPKGARYAAPAKKKVVALATSALTAWAGKERELRSVHWIAEKRLHQWSQKKSRGFTVTSIGRVTNQKVQLLQTRVAGGKTALEGMLERLGDRGQLIMLGSGDHGYENFLTEVSGRYENFIFLSGYSHELSLDLYRYGDLFLMPSSFEPCGISQMLAMRAGQPCLVNAVGGLRDTVMHKVTGYSFHGESAEQQAEAMVSVFAELIELHAVQPDEWKRVANAAAETRFTWESSAEAYVHMLYQI